MSTPPQDGLQGTPARPMRKLVLVGAIAGGALAAAGGAMAGLLLALLALLERRSRPGFALEETTLRVPADTVTMAVAILGLGYGLALMWTGWQALRGKPGRPLTLPRWGWWWLAVTVVLILGQVALSAGAKVLLPALHFMAGALPAFLFLSLAAGSARARGGWVSTRPAIGSMAWGGLGGTSLGILAEGVTLLVAAVAVGIWLTVAEPELVEHLQAWALEIERTGRLEDLDGLAPFFSSPVMVFGVLVLVGVLAPLVEETAKGLALPLVALTGHRLTRLDGFLLGVAAGAGFAVLEGILNGALALASPEAWGEAMVARGGAAAIHCFASGMVGLGWQAILTERDWVRGVSFGVLGLTVHGLWNVAASALALVSLQAPIASGMAMPLESGWLVPTVAVMAGIWIGTVLGLALIPKRL